MMRRTSKRTADRLGADIFESSFSLPLVLQRAGDHSVDTSDVLDQISGNSKAARQVGAAVIAHPDLASAVLPDQRLEWQLGGQQRRGDHQRCSGLRTAKDEHMGLGHREADAFGLVTMVNLGKDG